MMATESKNFTVQATATVGDVTRTQNSIDIACRVIDAMRPQKSARTVRKPERR